MISLPAMIRKPFPRVRRMYSAVSTRSPLLSFAPTMLGTSASRSMRAAEMLTFIRSGLL